MRCEDGPVTSADDAAAEPSAPESAAGRPGSDADSASVVFDSRATAHSVPEDVLGLVTGTFIAALGLSLLRAADSVTGGTAGLALLVDYATQWPFWLIYALINLPFAVLAIWKKGWSFTLRTALSIGLVSAFTVVNQNYLPIEHLNPVWGTFAGNLLAGVGLLILFRHRASLGGINIIALIVQEKTGFRAGWLQLIVDVVIILSALLVLPWQNVLISAVGAAVLNVVLALNHRPGRYIGH